MNSIMLGSEFHHLGLSCASSNFSRTHVSQSVMYKVYTVTRHCKKLITDITVCRNCSCRQARAILFGSKDIHVPIVLMRSIPDPCSVAASVQ